MKVKITQNAHNCAFWASGSVYQRYFAKTFIFWRSMDDQGLLSYQPKQTLSPKNYMLTWSHCASNIFRISPRYVFHPYLSQNDHQNQFYQCKMDLCQAFQLIFLLGSFQMLIITHEASVQWFDHWSFLDVFTFQSSST